MALAGAKMKRMCWCLGAGTGNAVTGIVPADGEDSPTSIAIGATDVYWTTSGEVRRVAKSGGTPVTVYGSEYEPYEVNIDDSNLYWFHLRQGTDQRDVDAHRMMKPNRRNGLG
jgi:hypothetical protein